MVARAHRLHGERRSQRSRAVAMARGRKTYFGALRMARDRRQVMDRGARASTAPDVYLEPRRRDAGGRRRPASLALSPMPSGTGLIAKEWCQCSAQCAVLRYHPTPVRFTKAPNVPGGIWRQLLLLMPLGCAFHQRGPQRVSLRITGFLTDQDIYRGNRLPVISAHQVVTRRNG